jgi:hypothetical protein
MSRDRDADIARDEVDQQLPAAAEGHVLDPHLRRALHHLRQQMRQAGRARAGIGEPRRLALRKRHQFRHARRRHGRVHCEHEVDPCCQRHRREVGNRVEGHPLIDRGIDRMGRCRLSCLPGEGWFDPIESGIRGRIRELIEELVEQELASALGRARHERGGMSGHRHGHRVRPLTGRFGPVEISVPRARLRDEVSADDTDMI